MSVALGGVTREHCPKELLESWVCLAEDKLSVLKSLKAGVCGCFRKWQLIPCMAGRGVHPLLFAPHFRTSYQWGTSFVHIKPCWQLLLLSYHRETSPSKPGIWLAEEEDLTKTEPTSSNSPIQETRTGSRAEPEALRRKKPSENRCRGYSSCHFHFVWMMKWIGLRL